MPHFIISKCETFTVGENKAFISIRVFANVAHTVFLSCKTQIQKNDICGDSLHAHINTKTLSLVISNTHTLTRRKISKGITTI